MERKIRKGAAVAMAAYCRMKLAELEARPGHAEVLARPILGYFTRARVRAWKRRILHYEILSREA